jgi:serine/threonine-protein kinase ATR
MNSKAKPKRLTAFAVPGTWKLANSTKLHSSSLDASDIGEFHFLVKQEAKGDLRKDARVQDLNNVVNRLIDSCVNSVSSLASHSRRLRLRTFAVTCLSEDTGVLEWVPHTDCFRNLITKSYNSQTTPFCRRRRGERLTDFDNSSLRLMYDKSQRLFFKQGNLTEAANEFGELCRDFPPVFSWWFVHSFNIDAHAWYEARLCFTLSAAAWSAVGHMIGLGDRHTENILVETTTGRLLHVDFDCIFDKALNLPRPGEPRSCLLSRFQLEEQLQGSYCVSLFSFAPGCRDCAFSTYC